VTHHDADDRGVLDSATLFRRHASFVASFLYRQGARPPDLEDLVQEVFLAAHRKGGYRPGLASATTFLAQLALEAELQHRRRASRKPGASRALEVASISEPPADPAQALTAKDVARKLQTALDAIPPEQRAVFVLYELEGESCESIANGLGLPLGTVHSRLHTARKAFAAHVARLEGLGDTHARPTLHQRALIQSSMGARR
jgi:RNA polymerase sigma-70 factor, ECF subfamily